MSKLKVILIVVLLAILALLGFLIANEIPKLMEYEEIKDENEEIVKDVVSTEGENNSDEDLVIDWDTLLSINSDVVAWIYIPDTTVNLPILQGETNTTYLYTNIYKEYSKGGSIFVDSENSPTFEDLNTIVYGHHLYTDSMFTGLVNYTEEDFWNSHQEVYIYLPNGEKRTYKVVSFHKIKQNDELYNTKIKDIESFFENVLKNNWYTTYYVGTGESKMLMLSTCTNINRNERYVLHAYLEKTEIGK